ncbi:MAG: GNAT family N-acetyltransferase [Clostridia bacterium]|nr:GNAT family N-acetyltransferase [Clostridia bacterium]
METEPKTEIWSQTGRGVLTETPLLLTACKAGQFGAAFDYPDGCVYKALFTYLSGRPDEPFFMAHPELFYESWLVCMSPEWESYVRELPMQAVFRREVMKPLCAESVKQLKPLPEGYSLTPFTPAVFEAHPFGHGGNYADFDDFSERGIGAAVLYKGQVVAAASSFLTFEDQVELDLYTDPEHRKRGLADHCTAEIMRQSSRKRLTVHWDAQNRMSAELAKGHGFQPLAEYAVFCLQKN